MALLLTNLLDLYITILTERDKNVRIIIYLYLSEDGLVDSLCATFSRDNYYI